MVYELTVTMEGVPIKTPFSANYTKVFPGLVAGGYLRRIFGNQAVESALRAGILRPTRKRLPKGEVLP